MYKTTNQFYSIQTNIKKSFANKIISKTKKLALSNDKYNEYLETFSSFNEKNVKMTINLDLEYPIIQPIKKQKSKHNHKQTFFSKQMKNCLLNQYFSNYESPKHKRTITETKPNNSPIKLFQQSNKQIKKFFICENDYFLNKDIKYFVNKAKNIKNYNFISLKKMPSRKINYDENKINNTYTNNNFFHKNNVENTLDKCHRDVKHDKKSEVFCLLDAIFYEKNKDEKFIYDEKKFMNHKNELYSYLETQLSSFIHRKKSISLLSKLSYNYINKIYGKINLQLNSIKIEILNNFSNCLVNSIIIPFDLLPLFYLTTTEQIGYILLYLIKEDFFSFKNIRQHKAFEILLTKEIIIKNKKLLFQFAMDENNEPDIMDGLMNNNLMRKNSNNIKFNILSLRNKNENKLQLMNNSKINFDKFEHIKNLEGKSIEKNLFENKITTLFFPWITSDHDYIIKISLPKIIVKFQNYNKQINNFIDKELLIFLYKNNFEKWNLYLSHYLFSLKNFRLSLNKMLSYYPKFLKYKTKPKIKKKTITSDNSQINSNCDKNLIYKNNKPVKKRLSVSNTNILLQSKKIDDVNILSVYNQEFKPSLNDNEYNFLLSDDKFVHLYKLKSYILNVYYCNKIQKPKVYVFNFNFFQMKILFYKSKYSSLEKVLSRLLKISNSKIILDYSYFDLFKSMNMKEVNNYFSENLTIYNYKITQIKNIKNIKNHNNSFEKNNEISLKLCTPEFVHISLNKNFETLINNGGWKRNEGKIKLKLIEKLVENDIDHWGKILSENKNDIESTNVSRKFTTSRINRSGTLKENTKKMFKYMLQKILKIK